MFGLFKRTKTVEPDLSFIGVDMHNHLIPGLDDGSPDVATSVAYIKQLHKLGYHRLICTPHIIMDMYPNSRDTIAPSKALLVEALEREGIPVKIDFAAEYMVNPDFEELVKRNELLTFGKNYILIEMSYVAPSHSIKEMVFELQMRGLQPVLAHPERYNYYHERFDKYEELFDIGCELQVNLLSLTGFYGKPVKKAAEKLIEQNLIAWAGTDLHHERHLNLITKLAGDPEILEWVNRIPNLRNKLL